MKLSKKNQWAWNQKSLWHIDITDLWGKYEKNMYQNLCRIIQKIPLQKIDFCKMFKKLNTSTEHGLEFLLLLKGNSFQNVTFFCKISQKVIEH